MAELVPFGKYKDQPIERQALTAEPVKILQASNIVELLPDGPPPRDARYSPQFPRVDRPNVVPLFKRDGWFTLAELGRVPPDFQCRSKRRGSIFPVKDAASEYLQRGWKLMKLPPRSKKPYKKSFASCTITWENLDALPSDSNIAVLFTTAGELKDLDCDYQEAADLAKAIGLSKGAAFGRKSVGAGHYLFNASGCEAKRFELPKAPAARPYPRPLPSHDGKPSRLVVELRGNDNTYTAFPPSVHPSGETIDWVGSQREPEVTTAAELRTLAGRHAFAATVLYFYPETASARYDVRMALTGALARSGMTADLITDYVQAVARLAGDPKWKEDFAERTEKRLKDDKETTGLTKLIEVLQLPEACLNTFHDWLSTDEEITTDIPERIWPTLDPAALYGLAGKVVALFEPHTEADPVALLSQFLILFGNALGRCAYYPVEGDRHYTNLFGVLVGRSSKSRKGTSAGRIRQLMRFIEEYWECNCITGGLSSGEGVIWRIRDEIRGPDKHGNDVVKFAAVDDKRLMLDEREFAQVLTVMKREGDTVSVIMRDAWDGRDLNVLTRTNPARVTHPHISISAHITEDELRRMLDEVSMASGWGNRFLFACVKRARELPHGGTLTQDEIEELGKKIRLTIYNKVHGISKEITMNAEARKFWTKTYHDLSQDLPGMLGAITGRGEAQTIRLALLYAVLDGSDKIKVVHLKAALALWKYCEDSARYIFGDGVGDRFADELLQALRNSGGMSRKDISNHFQRHQSKDKLDAALVTLQRQGRARCERRKQRDGKSGRPVEHWTAAKGN